MLATLYLIMSFMPIHVFLNVEKFNERPQLLHVGITFKSNCKQIRYDFHPFHSKGVPYVTEDQAAVIPEWLPNDGSDTSTDIFWGKTMKTWSEIQEYELRHLSQRRYVLTIYDCRHYVRDFTMWALDRPSPIWTLHKLYDAKA